MNRKHSQWKNRFQEVMKVCQLELKRTTDIGKKMLSASKTNSCLHESFEELGQLAAEEIEKGNLEWDHPRVSELIAQIKSCEQDLENIESQVHQIKKTNKDQQEASTKNNE